jgi:signal transduction histidine kinase
LVDAHGCTIYLLDDEEKMLKPIIALGNYDEGAWPPVKLGQGITGKVALSGKGRIVKIEEGNEDTTLSNDNDEPQYLLAVPLQVKALTIGAMALSCIGPHGFTPHDLELTSSLGNQAAVAIENARLYNATRQRNKELLALYSIAMSLGQTLEMSNLLDEILKQVPEVLGHEGGAIFLVSDSDKLLRLTHHHMISEPILNLITSKKYGKNAVNKAAEANKVVEFSVPMPKGFQDSELQKRGVDTKLKEMRLICTPLVSHRRVQGVLIIPAYTTKNLRAGDKRLLETLGRQIGMAIENAALYAQLQERAETLQKAYDELAEVDRLKDELVQNISHELRTPITFIKGYISLLLEGDLGDLGQEQISSLKIVNEKTEQLISLVNGILTLQILTTEVLRLESISPNHLADRAVEDAKIATENLGIKVVADYPEEMPFVRVDPTRITQVFDNLLQNAIKFSPEGGTITIRLRPLKAKVRVDIQDTGIGIPEDKIDRIFDRFFQVDGSMTRRYGGAGLGLAICRQIIDAHGGQISVHSTEDQGSTFTFTLPLA